ncbi:MAG: trimethylamine methyltransferase family protein [Thermoplasmata archaeon]
MAKARMTFLSEDEEELIHEKSIEMLSKIGVLVRSDAVLDVLEENGAKADRKKRIAYISEEMIKEAVSSAPKNFYLRAREKENDLELPAPEFPYITTDGLVVNVRDIETGETRLATRKDFAQFARLADALDSISFFWPIVTISDVPPELHNLYELWDSFVNCSMHVQGDCLGPEDAKRQLKLASLVVGGEEELRKRPVFSTAIDPISPLSFDGAGLEAQLIFSRAGIPVMCQSMCLGGVSSPVTLAGTIAMINAENLASLVISQSAARKSPHIYASSSTPANMSTGGINYLAPEFLLISSGAAQMARRYGRPCMVSNWGAGMKGLGIPMSFCELFGYAGTVLAGGDLVPGMGGLDDAMSCSLEQVVIDSFIWDNFKAFMRTVDVTENTIALDVVQKVGHGNSFLSHAHTARNFRKELFFFDREKLSMESTLSDKMVPRAKEIAKKILREHEPVPLDKAVIREGEKLLKEYARLI